MSLDAGETLTRDAKARPPGYAAAPLALVLTGGGARAAYQVGVLAGLAEKVGEALRFPIITGVSAGAINAACLAGSSASLLQAVTDLETAWLQLSIPQVFRSSGPALLASAARWGWLLLSGGRLPGPPVRGVLDTEPLRVTLKRFMKPDVVEENLSSGRLDALALSATSYATGETVTFVQGRSEVPAWRRAGRVAVRTDITAEHVLASSALPLLFPAIRVGNEYFGDGSLRQTAPLAPAIHLGANALLVISVRHGANPDEREPGTPPAYPPPAQILGTILNAIFLDALEADAERLERINRTLETLSGRGRGPEGLRPIRLAVIRPSRDLGEMARDLMHALPPALRTLVRSLSRTHRDGPSAGGADFLSYLLFERPYIRRLIDLGRRDAEASWPRLAPLVLGVTA